MRTIKIRRKINPQKYEFPETEVIDQGDEAACWLDKFIGKPNHRLIFLDEPFRKIKPYFSINSAVTNSDEFKSAQICNLDVQEELSKDKDLTSFSD